MNKLVIDELYIFSLPEKLAKRIKFKKGCNIITSNEVNGNDRGKSTIMKSIYYTLGADITFTTNWNSVSKIYILKIKINDDGYYIFRDKDIFKIYNINYERIFFTKNRGELGRFFKEKFKFYTFLPNRGGGFEITPPVFNFLINYTNQTKMDCTEFKAFEGLTQYKNGFKKYIMWEYMGIYTEEYFNLSLQKDELENEIKKSNEEIELKNNFINQIDKNTNNMDYSIDYENLCIELENKKDEYIKIVRKLSSLKKNLIKFRNNKEDILIEIKELNKLKKEKEKIDEKTYEVFDEIGKYIMLKNNLENMLIEIDKRIVKEEEKYITELDILKEYEQKLTNNKKEIDSVIEYKGMIALRNSYIKDKEKALVKVKNNKESLRPIRKKLKDDKAKMEKINNRYRKLMEKDTDELNLSAIIKPGSIDNILTTIKVDGSNIPLVTMMYYMNMLQLKYEFNKNSFIFPVVIDSPNNTESDKEKSKKLYNYIFSKMNNDTQYIISGIGLKAEDYKDIIFDNIIVLKNEKYKLLNNKDFIDNIEILSKFLD